MFYFLQGIFYISLSAVYLGFQQFILLLHPPYQFVFVLCLPLCFMFYHCAATHYYQKKFAVDFYLPAALGVAMYFAFGSFSQTELVEFGFKIEDISSFLVYKTVFHFWAILLLPAALKYFLRK